MGGRRPRPRAEQGSPRSQQHVAGLIEFYEAEDSASLAVAARCDAIVTHNVRDFAGAIRFGVTIVTPGDFLAAIEEEV